MALRPASKGEQLESAQLVQLIREDTPGVYNPNGRRHVLTMLKGDFQPEDAFESFRPDGASVLAALRQAQSFTIESRRRWFEAQEAMRNARASAQIGRQVLDEVRVARAQSLAMRELFAEANAARASAQAEARAMQVDLAIYRRQQKTLVLITQQDARRR